MRVYEGTKETFGVIAWACQLFEYVRIAGGLSSDEQWVGCHACNVDSVGSAIAACEESAARAFGVV